MKLILKAILFIVKSHGINGYFIIIYGAGQKHVALMIPGATQEDLE